MSMGTEEDKTAAAELLTALEDYEPEIPDELVSCVLRQNGLETTDPRVRKVIALSARKFVTDIAHEALQYARNRHRGKKGVKERRLVLTPLDLSDSLRELGVRWIRPEYFADKSTTGYGVRLQQIKKRKDK